MIKVTFDPTLLTGDERAWWEAWEARALRKAQYHADALAAGEEPQFDGSIWSDLKAWLLEKVFHGKCAYCETKISGGFFGDAEHFRPKANVTLMAPAGKVNARLANDTPHQGYHWLAYDWQNLLPSCQRCNNRKSDQFPVAGQYQGNPAPRTGDLNAAEEPLLIYPYDENPSQFLKFGKAGVVTAIDGNPRGLETIRVLGLDRYELTEERWRAQAQALQGLETQVGRMLSEDGVGSERLAQYMGPQAPYSRAVYDWFMERIAKVSERVRNLAESAHSAHQSEEAEH